MAHSAAVFIGLLVAVVSVSAEGIWPSGQDFVYEYTANVRAAGIEPAHVGSKYSINGKLRLQAEGDDAFIKLDDVRYQLYNGELPEKQQPSSLPLPADASPLTTPFGIHYKDGKVKKLFTEVSDPLWVLNMKKGLASLLQLDLTQHMRMDVPSAFWGEENSIFGTCDVGYSFISDGDYNVVTKTVNPDTCKDFPFRVVSNIEQTSCGQADKENPVSSVYKRVYRIKLGDSPVVTDISSEFIVGFVPLRANSDLDYIKIEQKLHLVKKELTTQKLVLSQAQELQDLGYSLAKPDTLPGTDLDWSQGSVKVDTDSLVNKAVTKLADILQYQQESHVDDQVPNFKRQALIDNYVSFVLGRLGVEGLSTVYSQLSEGTSAADVAKRDLFVKLLPQAGTHASAITIRNLIRKHKVKTWTAQTLLQALPMNVRLPSEKLLQELEDLIHLSNEYSEEVRHAAILSFATLVYKTVKDNTREDFRNRTVDKYADIYFRQIAENNADFSTQYVYVQGLGNMKVSKAAEYLEHLVMEGEQFGRHIQFLASRFTLRSVISNYNKAYRIFWPILINPKQHLQMRSYAMLALVESASSMDHFMAVQSYMVTQRNNIHLYKLFYKVLQGKVSSTNPCLSRSSEFATRVLRFTPAPLVDHLGTGLETFDYLDEKYGFGKSLRLQSIADQATGYPSVLLASFHDVLYGNIRNPYTVYLKLEGLDQVLWGVTDQGEAEPTKAPSKVDMMGLLNRKQPLNTAEFIRKVSEANANLNRPIHIELAVYKHDQAIYSLYVNNSVLGRILSQDIPMKIKELINLQNVNLHQVDFPTSIEYHVPTDLGVPLVFSRSSSNVFSVLGSSNVESGMSLETTFRQSAFSAVRASILNPLVGAWHGVQKVISQDAQFPLRIGVKRDELGYRMVFARPQGAEGLDATIGSRWYTQSSSFLFEEETNNNLLGASCPTCERRAVNTKGADNLQQVVFLQTSVPGTGLAAEVKAFNCERPISVADLRKLVLQPNEVNAHNLPLMRSILGLSHLLTYGELSPPSGQCGFLARLYPDPEVGEGSQVEFTLKVTGGEVPGGNIVLQGVKLRAIGEWVLKGSNGDVIRKTDVRMNIATTAGQEDNSVSLQLANYHLSKPTSKWCSSVTKKYPARKQDALAFGWGNEESNSQLTINVGSFLEDVDGECPSDSVSVTINLKGEISEEQKERAQGDAWPYGECREDKVKPEWKDSDFIPNTQACYIGAILLTTARKMTYSASYSKLPPYLLSIVQHIEEMYRSVLAPHFQLLSGEDLAEPGTAQLIMQYSAYKPTVDVIVKSPTHHYGYLNVPTGASSADEYNPIFDNTHQSRFHLLIETFGISKPCFVSTENVYTADNATVPHKQTSDWVLVAGIAGDTKRFSAYTKTQGGTNPLVVKVVNDGVTLELSRDGAKLNGSPISLDQGVQYPADDPNYAIRVWKMGELVMAYSRRTAVYIYYTGVAVDVEQPVTNRGRASGLCGNLNGDPTDD